MMAVATQETAHVYRLANRQAVSGNSKTKAAMAAGGRGPDLPLTTGCGRMGKFMPTATKTGSPYVKPTDIGYAI